MHTSALITRYYFAANFVASVPFIWKIHKKINKPRMNVISKTNENKRAGGENPILLDACICFTKYQFIFIRHACIASEIINKHVNHIWQFCLF